MEQKTVSTSSLIVRTKTITTLRRTLWVLNHIYHQALTLLTVIFIWIMFENYDKSSSFFWHIFLSTFAYIPLMGVAIILFSEDNLLTLFIPRTRRYWIHGVLLTLSCLAVTIGISVEVDSKRKRDRAHFESDHAILGLVSWLLIFVSVLLGLLASNTRTFHNYVKPVVIKFIHNFLGIAAFLIGVGSFYTKISFMQRLNRDNHPFKTMSPNTEIISTKQRIFLISQGVFQFLLAVFVTSTVWVVAISDNWQEYHTWHVFLSTVGFSFFMAEAVAVFSPGNVFVLGFGKLSRGLLHGVIMTFATIAIIAGVSVKIQDKTNNKYSHFDTTHSITGLLAFLLTMMSFLMGFLAAFPKIVYRIGIKPLWVKKLHNFLGISAYILGSISLGYGLRQYFSDISYKTNTGLIVIMTLYGCLNLLGPLIHLLRI
ncbi:hypothetical protein GWI33_019131 [Rhynchophorus ferrugineus]|uniref:ascorbate ferrireductase (transmembrane) n=1 Tax=Rhynchophorus ferrugineus TaxID=354439 RepID=A0A834M0R6_RHYFE|nr:hypothetical protein GWI33_019131 [Rhynchophorus ferrugineus]